VTAQRKSARTDSGVPAASRVDAVLAGLPPSDAALVRDFIDGLDPEGRRRRLARRDAALIEIVGLMRSRSETQAIEDAAGEIRRYVGNAWPRERALSAPPVAASRLRAALWQFANANNGDDIGRERIRQILALAGGIHPLDGGWSSGV